MFSLLLKDLNFLLLFLFLQTLVGIFLSMDCLTPVLKVSHKSSTVEDAGVLALSPIGRIKILTYLIWGFLGAAILDCIIRSCDLFYWFIRTCLGPTVVPAAITSLELFCVLTMCYFSDNVSSKENIKILWLIFMFYYGDIIAIKNSYWLFTFT